MSRTRDQDPAAMLPESGRRAPATPIRARVDADRPPGAGAAGAPRSNLRLDPGHHRSQSRWLAHEGRPRLAPPSAAAPRCLAIVATPEARALAELVNWVAGPAGAPPAGPAGVGRCLASVGGRTAADPAGLVEFWPAASPAEDYLLAHDHPGTAGPDGPSPAVVERYALAPGADWWGADLKADAGRYRFRAFRGEAFHAEVRLGAPGARRVLPALAALAIGVRLGLDREAILDRLASWAGPARGFERRGTYRGATLVDDDATGPGAVGEALRLARAVFGRRIIRAVYSPSDPRDLPSPRDFDEADYLVLVDPGPPGAESTRLLGASLRSSGAAVAIRPSLDDAIRGLDRELEPGDVLVTLGAAGVGTIADAFLRRLSRDRHGR